MANPFKTIVEQGFFRIVGKRSRLVRSTASRFTETAPRDSGPPSKRVVVVEPGRSFQFYQQHYFSVASWRLIPNVAMIDSRGTLIFETNRYGMKGPEIDTSKKLVAWWGDSVVFGIGRGWVEGLGIGLPGYQFLNGGLEGAPLDLICEIAAEKNRALAIHYNVLFPGWHTIRWPNKVRKLLVRAVDDLPGPILCTVPTSLSPALASTDLSSHILSRIEPALDSSGLVPIGLNQFYFWAGIPYSTKNAQKLLARVQGQNAVVRALARKKGIPLIDLYERFKTDDSRTMRANFFDAGHPRVEAYPALQAAVAEELKHAL